MSTLQMNTVVNYTLTDYVNLLMTIMNYLFIHDKMTYWMDSMSEKSLNTFIQVNFLMGTTLFSYSYVCFFYNDFLRGLYTTIWSFMMFYNIMMAQLKMWNKQHQVNLIETDDSDTSDDEMDVDEEGEAFEEEVLKEREQDEQIVENILNKILELKVGEILVNEFKNASNVEDSVVANEPVLEIAAPVPEVVAPVPEVVAPVPEVVAPVPEVVAPVLEVAAPVLEVAAPVSDVVEPLPEVVQDTVEQSEEQNSVSDSPNAENTPMETEEATT